MAEFGRDLIRERTRAGLAAARRRGKKIGRARVHVPRARVLALLEQGHSTSAVVRELGVSRTTLRRELERLSWSRTGGIPPKTERQQGA